MGLLDFLRSKQARAEKAAEKKDRGDILSGLTKLNDLAEKLSVQQGTVNEEIKKIQTRQDDLKNLFASKDVLVRFDFFLYPRKKRGFVKAHIDPKYMDALYNLMKSNSGADVK
ncbi:MAG: hypothetical protein V1701_02535 [Planctomycetota bacterium]